MTDRDHFAAAALTGLLARVSEKLVSPDAIRDSAYAWADLMLAARDAALRPEDAAYTEGVSEGGESKNLDAVPAARAETVVKEPNGNATGEPGGDLKAKLGTGDTRAAQEPVAWGVYRGDDLVSVCKTREVATAWIRSLPERNCWIVPLYAAPPAGSVRLTDEERRELEAAAIDYERGGGRIVYGRQTYLRRAATIRGLLARASKEGGR